MNRRLAKGGRLATGAGAAALAAMCLTGTQSARAASDAVPPVSIPAAEAAVKGAAPDTVLVSALQTELKRAMSSLGTDAPGSQQPKPYFLSYAVSDATGVSMTAQHGAITNSNGAHRRSVDVQVRIGTPQEDNTHGDHRTSALTTLPLPLTDDRSAIERIALVRDEHGVRASAGRLPEGEDRAAGAGEGRRCIGRLQRGEAAGHTASPGSAAGCGSGRLGEQAAGDFRAVWCRTRISLLIRWRCRLRARRTISFRPKGRG